MTFWEAFFRVILLRPGQALRALYWHLTKRRVRARNEIRRGAALLPNAHYFWIRTREEQPDYARRLSELGQRQTPPSTFEIALLDYGDLTAIERTLKSLEDQKYPHWQLCIASPQARVLPKGLASSTNLRSVEAEGSALFDAVQAALRDSSADLIIPVRAGDTFAPAALLYFAEALADQPDASILYGDEDEISRRGRRSNPWFKPQWNEELFLGLDYLSGACALSVRAAAQPIQGSALATMSDLLFALAGEGRPIVHVPHIVIHKASAERPTRDEHMEAATRLVQPRGGSVAPGPFDTVKVTWPLPAELPLVSMIVPTRDRLELLQPCIDGVLATTSYSPYEVLVVDNGSSARATHEYLRTIAQHPAVRVLSYNQPYNFSAINNFAAGQASGAYLCLLNNDTEVIEERWLTEMMRFAVRDEIGAVGAKLLYENGAIQHAGVVVGMGDAAGHAHRFTRSDETGYFRLPHVAHFVTAVTAACMVVARRKFDAVGGLDEEHFPVAYNDVDFCLKLQLAGYRNVYVPHAVLLHHESMSRGDDKAKQHIKRYSRELATLQQRWGTKTYQDPMLNPNLDRYSETFIVALD